jgi:HPt (histidine-containing phosphotransfer) domain-containing protein
MDAVDPSILRALTDRLGERGAEFRDSLIDTWANEVERRLAELDQAAATGDRDGVARAAHAMKSSCAALGALAMSRSCLELERAVRAGAQVDLTAAAAQVRAEADRARIGLDALRLS